MARASRKKGAFSVVDVVKSQQERQENCEERFMETNEEFKRFITRSRKFSGLTAIVSVSDRCFKTDSAESIMVIAEISPGL